MRGAAVREQSGSDGIVTSDVEMPMRDGVVLRADVMRAPGARPAVLFRTPYGKRAMSSEVLRPEHCFHGGFQTVVQDTRGRFASDGGWAALLWDQEALDTYDSVEWVAAQPWCDGRVVMAGTSYVGIVQLLGAMERPPHLRAIAPAMTTDQALDRRETGGMLRLEQVVTWLAYMAADWLGRAPERGEPLDPAALARVAGVLHDPFAHVDRLALEQIDVFDLPGFPLRLADLLRSRRRVVPDFDYAQIAVPTLSTTGWYDVYCAATIRSFQALAAREPGRHRLIVGPWAHTGPLPGVVGEVHFGLAASAAAARTGDAHLAFFRDALAAAPDAPLGDGTPAVRYFLMGADQWREAATWPPPGTAERAFHLGGAPAAGGAAGLLSEAPPAEGGTARFTYDPLDPCPTHGGRVLWLGRQAPGPLDQRPLLTRPDVLRYEGEPLAAPLDVTGPVRLQLAFGSSAPDTDLVAKLLDVRADGRLIPVAEGSLRLRERDRLRGDDGHAGDEGCAGDGRAGGDDAPAPPPASDAPAPPLAPGEVVAVELDLGHTAHRFAAGHRVALLVTSSSFPALDRNPNTGALPGTDGAAVPAEQRIHHGHAHPSALLLTVAEAPR
jgi:putative CocE/NonD family hydrolase